MEVVAEAGNGRKAVQLARRLNPDVVIMDISMPELNGIEATRQIIAELPHVKVVALSMHTDDRSVSEMFRAGASGYLSKDCAFEELARALRAVAKNQKYVSPEIAGIVVSNYANNMIESEASAVSILTAREREVLQLLTEGNSAKQIAFKINLSVKTVETHRQNIMQKLHIDSIANLTKYAIREGLTPLQT